jgi:acetoin:2,6-dichlorophenolindophenol oxidoreductase subunit alpha
MLTSDQLIEMHTRMLRIRLFDTQVATMVKRGELPGAVHTSMGQEAEVVGACMAMRSDDYMTGNHRSHGHPIGKGARLPPLMAEILGKATGVCKGKGGSMHLADFSVGSLGESGVVGSAIPIATGAALASKTLKQGRAAFCFFGDGAANQGALHESMNIASIWQLPVVYICENNQYASTTAASDAISVPRIAVRAAGYNMPGITVEDGQNPVSVYEAVAHAAERAREGAGPSLVEVMTYRYSEHSEGLLHAGAYRDPDEYASWKERDPIVISRGLVQESGAATSAQLDELADAVQLEVQAAVDFALASPFPAAADAFEDLYSVELPLRDKHEDAS